jgi:peroxidase
MRRQSVLGGGAGWWWRGGGAVAWWGAVVLAHLVTPGRAGLLETNPGLAYNFYQTSCPSAEATVKSITWQMVAANPALAGRLLRLHFHDCFVQVRPLAPAQAPLPCLCFLLLAGTLCSSCSLPSAPCPAADRPTGKCSFFRQKINCGFHF